MTLLEGCNLELPSIKCPCGKVGRFVMDKRVGDLKLCLGCMQYWLSEKLKGEQH